MPQLVERARDEKADAVLVSQVVTQRDAHLLNTREMSAAFREAYPPDRRPLLVVGGPRFDETMAGELGVDRVFTRGTTPGEVASYLVHRLVAEGGRRDMAPRSAATVTHRRYVPYSHAHYAGNLVDGAYGLGLFGDVATELCIRPTATRGCSRPTPTCSSSRRCAPATSSRSPASWSGSAPGRGSSRSRCTSSRAGRADRRAARGGRGCSTSRRRHHRHRHRRRPAGLTRPELGPACRRRHAGRPRKSVRNS